MSELPGAEDRFEFPVYDSDPDLQVELEPDDCNLVNDDTEPYAEIEDPIDFADETGRQGDEAAPEHTDTGLEPVVRSLATGQLARIRSELATRVDWPSAIGKYIGDTGYVSRGGALASAGAAEPMSGKSLHYLLFETFELQDLQRQIVAAGDILPEGQGVQPPEDWQLDTSFVSTTQAWIKSVETTASNYLTSERKELLLASPQKKGMLRLAALAMHAGYCANDKDVTPVPMPTFVYALETQATHLIKDFGQWDKDIIHTSAESWNEELIQFEGTDLPQRILNIDGETWFYYRMMRHPREMAQGLQKVIFHKGLIPSDVTGKPDWLGCMDNKGIMTLAVDLPVLANNGNLQATQEGRLQRGERAEALNSIAHTLDHEIGHHAHKNNLTIAELRAWDEIRAKEPYDAKNPREDYACSVADFMNSPWFFYNSNPQRFQNLNERYGRYSPAAINVARRRANLPTEPLPGITPDEYHEQEQTMFYRDTTIDGKQVRERVVDLPTDINATLIYNADITGSPKWD